MIWDSWPLDSYVECRQIGLCTLVLGDALLLLPALESESIDVVTTDPPYNLGPRPKLKRPGGKGKTTDGWNEKWDNRSRIEMETFTDSWLRSARATLTERGTIWVMGMQWNVYLVGHLMQFMGYHILNEIIWVKANPMPQLMGVRFTYAHENIIWAQSGKTKKPGKYTFNYTALKESNGGKQMRSDWYFPVCRGKERLLGPDGKKLHPTQKPRALFDRMLLASSNPGDVVLDPFMGVGTSAIAAWDAGCNYIGIENDPAYYRAAVERVKTCTMS